MERVREFRGYIYAVHFDHLAYLLLQDAGGKIWAIRNLSELPIKNIGDEFIVRVLSPNLDSVIAPTPEKMPDFAEVPWEWRSWDVFESDVVGFVPPRGLAAVSHQTNPDPVEISFSFVPEGFIAGALQNAKITFSVDPGVELAPEVAKLVSDVNGGVHRLQYVGAEEIDGETVVRLKVSSN